ncbi:putative metal-binding motif-containing protein [Persicimonas caeni]|nr:putative metal-binding motif-containing protein [Persicimonas caeni]
MQKGSLIAVVVALVVGLAACDGDSDNDSASNGQGQADASVADAGSDAAGDADTVSDTGDDAADTVSDTGSGQDSGGTDTDDPNADNDGDGAVASVDCDDDDPLRAPGFAEGCDAIDRDCDGTAVEPDTVSFFPAAGGDPIALTDQLASASLANPAELTLTEDGELRFCEGDFAVGVAAGSHTVTVTGDDQSTTTLEATGGTCPIDSDGDLSVRDMTLVGRDSNCLAVIRGHGPTLDVQDVTIRDHAVTGYGAAAISIGNETSASVERTTIEDVTQALFAKVAGGSTCVFDIDDLTISGQADKSEFWCGQGTTVRNVTLTDSIEGFEIWSNVTVDGVTITNNGSSASPAAELLTLRRAGSVTITNVVATDNVSDRTAFNLLANSTGDLTLSNAEFRNNTGAGILGLGAETVTVRDVVVANNASGVNQVINVFSDELASLSFHNLTVENNTSERAALYKGYQHSVTPTFTGANVFRNNASSGAAGALFWHLEDGATIDLSSVTFEGNSADDIGGAVRLSTSRFGNAVTLVGGTYRNNTSGADGGAVNAAGMNLTVQGGSYQGNTAAGQGGAIYSENLVAVDGGTFEDNTAAHGGAIQGKFQIPNATITVSNATFRRNTATTAGGVVDLFPSIATTSMGNVQFNACTFGTGNDANTPGDVHLSGSASPAHQTPPNGTGLCELGNSCSAQ